MAYEGKLNRLDDNRWEIPMDESIGMRANAVIYADEAMISSIRSDNAPSRPPTSPASLGSSGVPWPCRTSTGDMDSP